MILIGNNEYQRNNVVISLFASGFKGTLVFWGEQMVLWVPYFQTTPKASWYGTGV